MVHYHVMKFINRIRERRVASIERRVGRLSVLLSGLDPELHDEEYQRAERERARLWLQRSRIVQKLPPVYEGDTQ